MTADLFGQVVEDPEVVVSGEQMDVHPLVGQLGQLAQTSGESARNGSFVFVPKIKQVAHHVERIGIFLYLVEPVNELFFAHPAGCLVRCPEVQIGNEVDSAHRPNVLNALAHKKPRMKRG